MLWKQVAHPYELFKDIQQSSEKAQDFIAYIAEDLSFLKVCAPAEWNAMFPSPPIPVAILLVFFFFLAFSHNVITELYSSSSIYENGTGGSCSNINNLFHKNNMILDKITERALEIKVSL